MKSSKKGESKKTEDKDKLTILMDCNAICHMAKHAIKGLSHNEQSVGVIYGFLTQVFGISRRFNTKHFAFAWDSRKSKRKEQYYNYKRNRKKEYTEEDVAAFEQFTLLRQSIIPQLGFKNNFVFTGYEADDIIAKITKDHKGLPFVIISNDNDLQQLLSETCFIWHPRIKNNVTIDSFVDSKGIRPDQWPMVKSLMGDLSDNITGLEGVGPVTALRIVNQQISHDDEKYLKENQDLIDRNMKLIKLPYPGLPKIELDFKEQHYIADFVTICKRFGFKTMLTQNSISGWQERFEMV